MESSLRLDTTPPKIENQDKNLDENDQLITFLDMSDVEKNLSKNESNLSSKSNMI